MNSNAQTLSELVEKHIRCQVPVHIKNWIHRMQMSTLTTNSRNGNLIQSTAIIGASANEKPAMLAIDFANQSFSSTSRFLRGIHNGNCILS